MELASDVVSNSFYLTDLGSVTVSTIVVQLKPALKKKPTTYKLSKSIV